MIPGGLALDRGLGRPARRVVHQHPAGRGSGLDPRGGVDHVARDHPLALCTHGHRDLARRDSGAHRESGFHLGHGGNQLERRAHRPFGVILLRHGCAPDCDDGVADELLDRAAVPFDHLGGDLEVARQQLAHVLGVAALGEGCEPHQIGEQDRRQAPLGDRRRRFVVGYGTLGERGAALAAEAVIGRVQGAARRAGDLKRRAALGAEPAPRPVLGRTGLTAHGPSVTRTRG